MPPYISLATCYYKNRPITKISAQTAKGLQGVLSENTHHGCWGEERTGGKPLEETVTVKIVLAVEGHAVKVTEVELTKAELPLGKKFRCNGQEDYPVSNSPRQSPEEDGGSRDVGKADIDSPLSLQWPENFRRLLSLLRLVFCSL